jgi:1-acyl-sn-glycerol-3-phosphate acyltransferase
VHARNEEAGVAVNPVYATAVGASLTMFSTFRWNVRVTGAEHLPRRGPAVLATNHVSYLDFVFGGYAARQAGRRGRFVAKAEVFDHNVTGPLMRGMRHIRVERGGDTDATLREVAGALRAGDVVGMFPEGTISRSFVPLAGRPGAARMAVENRVPLIPGAIWGSQRIFTKGRSFTPARATAVSIDLGPAVPYDADEDPLAVHQRLMDAIGALVDTAQRRYPQHPAGPDDHWWLPAHLGGTAPTPEEAAAQARAEADERRRRHGG